MSKDGKAEKTVLHHSMGGGPQGLGDPEDRHLRKIEKQVLVPQRVRAEAKVICKELMVEFEKCGKEKGLMMWYHCRPQANIMHACQDKVFHDTAVIEQCTTEYLDDRSYYRLTGIGVKKRNTEQEKLRREYARNILSEQEKQGNV